MNISLQVYDNGTAALICSECGHVFIETEKSNSLSKTILVDKFSADMEHVLIAIEQHREK